MHSLVSFAACLELLEPCQIYTPIAILLGVTVKREFARKAFKSFVLLEAPHAVDIIVVDCSLNDIVLYVGSMFVDKQL